MKRNVNNILQFDGFVKRVAAIVSASLVAAPVSAQMNNTVEVETSVKPVVRDANKVNVLPSRLESNVEHFDVNYSNQQIRTTQFVFSPMDVYASEEANNGAPKGFVTAGFGSSGNLNLRGAYGFDLTDVDALDVELSCGGFYGKANNKDFGIPFKSRYYTTYGTIGYTRKYAGGLSELFVKGKLDNQVFNYQLPETVFGNNRQHDTFGGLYVGSTDCRLDNGLRLNGGVGMDFFSQSYVTNLPDSKYRESQLKMNVDGGYCFDEDNSINLDLDLYHSGYAMDEVGGITAFHVTPYYKFEDYDISLKAGILLGTDGDFAPDVRFDYQMSEYTQLHAHVSGHDEDNGFRRLTALTPYFCLTPNPEGELKMKSEFHQLDMNLGFKFRTDAGWYGDINFGYDKSKNRAELMPVLFDADKVPSDNLTYSNVVFVDGSRFYANMNIGYSYKDVVKFDFKNQFNGWAVSDDMKDIVTKTRPVLDFDWNVDWKLNKSVYVGVDWKIQSFDNKLKHVSVEANGVEQTYKVYERPTTSDLGLNARYVMTKIPLTVYANIDNLLNSKFDRYYGYRAIGTNFIAGVSYTF